MPMVTTNMKWIAVLTRGPSPSFRFLPRPFGLRNKSDALRELCARHVTRQEKWLAEGEEIAAYTRDLDAALEKVKVMP